MSSLFDEQSQDGNGQCVFLTITTTVLQAHSGGCELLLIFNLFLKSGLKE